MGLFFWSSRGQQITEILKVTQTRSKADIKHPPSSSTWKIQQIESRHKFSMSPNKIICYRLWGLFGGKLISSSNKVKQFTSYLTEHI